MKKLRHFEIFHTEDGSKILNTNLLFSLFVLIICWWISPDHSYLFITIYIFIFILIYHLHSKVRFGGKLIKIYKDEVLNIKKTRISVAIIVGLFEIIMPILVIINLIFSITFIILKIEFETNPKFQNLDDVIQFILLNLQVKGVYEIILKEKISVILSFIITLLTLSITSIIIAVCIKSLEVIYIGMRGDDEKFIKDYTKRFQKLNKKK
jgi:hypothetical protein